MIKIVEENEFFMVLIKSATYSVHNQKPSLVEDLTAMKKPIHFVNRLDQETSGLMVVAKKPEYHEDLSESLKAGHKYYRGLLRGPWKQKADKVILTKPLSDKAEGRKNPQGLADDRSPCETHLEKVRSNAYFTEVVAEIMTGRQHQIRKHCALIKQPIVGDKRYNDKEYNARIGKMYGIERMHLHAEKIEFEFKKKSYSFKNGYSLDAFFKELPPKKV